MIKIGLGAAASAALAAGLAAVPAAAGAPDGWTWNRVAQQPANRIVSDAAAAFHEQLGLAVIIAGEYNGVYWSQDETWTWNGKSWTQLDIEPPNPPGHIPAMAYDAKRGEIVYFGGLWEPDSLDHTWVWDGGEWEQRFPKHSPSARYGSAMAYDPVREKVVLYGGHAENDTWTWNGRTWKQVQTRGEPSIDYQGALAYDPATETLLLTGGFDNSRETWQLDGRRWRLVDVHDTVIGRYRGIATVNDRVVMVGRDEVLGGRGTASYVWDGDDWKVLPARGPEQRADPVVVYDPEDGRAIVFGGVNRASGAEEEWMSDTWLLTPPS